MITVILSQEVPIYNSGRIRVVWTVYMSALRYLIHILYIQRLGQLLLVLCL